MTLLRMQWRECVKKQLHCFWNWLSGLSNACSPLMPPCVPPLASIGWREASIGTVPGRAAFADWHRQRARRLSQARVYLQPRRNPARSQPAVLGGGQDDRVAERPPFATFPWNLRFDQAAWIATVRALNWNETETWWIKMITTELFRR
jgi:hypothetical protein